MADPINIDADVVDVTATSTRQSNLALAVIPWILLVLAILALLYFYLINANEKNKLTEVKKAAEIADVAAKKTISDQEEKITKLLSERTAIATPPPTIPVGMSLVDSNEIKRLVDCCANKAQPRTKAIVAKPKAKSKKSLAKKSGAAFVPAISATKPSPSPATVFPATAVHGDCFQLTLPQGQGQ